MSRATPVTLLTGATGFLGAALTARLLARGHAVRCVVRGATHDRRLARLDAALGALPAADRGRIEVVAGDLAEEDLGLSPADFAALGRGVDRIVHCGARVNMTLPYASLYPVNVRATESLLTLAEACSATFCYVSSMAAVAARVTGEPFELVDPVSGGYGQSKWSADRLVGVACQEGRLRAVTVRPGRVTAHSRTGRSNPDDLLEQVIRLCVRLGAAPALETGVRLSPVDWVSRLAVALCEEDASHGRAYHLVTTETLPWSAVLEVLRTSGYHLDELPYATWRARVADTGRDELKAARLAATLPGEPLVFDSHPANRPVRARRQLAERFPDPPPARALLRSTVAAWQRSGELPVPASSGRRSVPGAAG